MSNAVRRFNSFSVNLCEPLWLDEFLGLRNAVEDAMAVAGLDRMQLTIRLEIDR